MEDYGSTFKINRIITLKKHPDPILSHEDCKVKLLAVYTMTSYEKEEAAIHANRTNAKLVDKIPEIDMTKDQVHELLFALAHKGTAYLACYRTPVWEIVWRFVESEFNTQSERLWQLTVPSQRNRAIRRRQGPVAARSA